MTATGDPITGPGAPTVMIGGMPASVLGDMVSGAACVGSITVCTSTVMIGGKPAANIGATVVGTNPASGVPVTTAVAKGCPTVLL